MFTKASFANLVETACTAGKSGALDGNAWMYLPVDNKKVKVDDPVAANTMAEVMFSDMAYFMSLQLRLYAEVLQQIRMYYTPLQVHVFVKGSSALAMRFCMHPELSKVFKPSDLDMAVYINPTLPEFEEVHAHVLTLVSRVFAKHKQSIDRTFFISQDRIREDQKLLNDEQIEAFKEAHADAFAEIDMTSPLESTAARNIASSRSYVIEKPQDNTDEIVLIYTPSFKDAERIPLHRTPVSCSVNRSIDYVNNGHRMVFDLVRMKWTMINADNSKHAIDFVDCVVPRREDTELGEYWGRIFAGEHTVDVIYMHSNMLGSMPVIVPTMRMSAGEIWKMLHIYESPESKREARMKKLAILDSILFGGI